MSPHPTILWAQHPDCLYLTFEIWEPKNISISLSEDGKVLTFSCDNTNTRYSEALTLFESCESWKEIVGDRHVELKLQKKSEGWWSRLLESKDKVHYVKIDFSKWVDEDDWEEQKQMPFDMDQFGANSFPGMDMSGFKEELEKEAEQVK